MRRDHPILVTAAVMIAVVGLVGLTFVPAWRTESTSGFGMVVVFGAIGALLAAAAGATRWWSALAFAILGAAWVEAAQAAWLGDESARIGDFLWGGFGACLGVVTVMIVRRQRAVRRQAAERS